jgi:hypothetical protein
VGADAYLAARAAFERVNANVTNLGTQIARVGEILKVNRSSFCFSNTEGGFPAEVVMGRQSRTEDGNTWPSAKAINAALMEWHQTRQAMLTAYGSIPQDQRSGVVPPPQ